VTARARARAIADENRDRTKKESQVKDQEMNNAQKT
jgi:hypothetical protein